MQRRADAQVESPVPGGIASAIMAPAMHFSLLKVRISSDRTIAPDGRPPEVRAASLRGNEVRLVVAGNVGGRDGIHRFDGRIVGDRIEGEILTGTRSPERTAWSAQRQ